MVPRPGQTGEEAGYLRFPGQYYDEETGLHYNYFRDYQPMIGRYVEADPIGIKRGTNHLYVYSADSPAVHRDTRGLDVELCARQMAGKSAQYVIPHCYFCVNDMSYSWHPQGFLGSGITVGDEDCGSRYCREVKCCPEKQADFEQCVIDSARSDIGNEGGAWVPSIHDCCTWTHKIVGECRRKHCRCCK